MPSPERLLESPCPLRRFEPLARWTTLRIGGPAEHFYEPLTPEDLARLLDELRASPLPWRLLGGGANTLAPDGGVPGAVIHTGRMRRVFAEGSRLRAWAGLTLPALVNAAVSKGLAGLEALVGVPGHVGGALAMNAGSGDWGLWDEVEEVVLWLPDGRVLRRTPDEVRPAYRDGNLAGAVVLEAVFRLRPDEEAAVRDRMSALLRKKNATQPVRLSSAGCAFKNPPGDSAGRLVDAAGLKGARAGGARISDLHANFIVNTGGATAGDVRELVGRAQRAVRERFGVELATELVIWPEPEAPVGPPGG